MLTVCLKRVLQIDHVRLFQPILTQKTSVNILLATIHSKRV